MDSAGRNFTLLLAASLALVAYALCGLVAYALLPLARGQASIGAAAVLPLVSATALVAGSAAMGLRTVERHCAAGRRLRWRIATASFDPPPSLLDAARLAGLEGRIVAVAAEEPFAFAYGLLARRVAISGEMLRRLSPDELRAALEHERYHVRSFDPLRELVARTLSESLFLLPAIGLLHRRYATARELAADRLASRACGARPLAGALLAALGGPRHEAQPGVSLAEPGQLERRLSQLETGCTPGLGGIDGPTFAWSALGVLTIAGLLVAAVAGVGGAQGLSDFLASCLSPICT